MAQWSTRHKEEKKRREEEFKAQSQRELSAKARGVLLRLRRAGWTARAFDAAGLEVADDSGTMSYWKVKYPGWAEATVRSLENLERLAHGLR